jgi:hypothetical protein
MNISANIKCPRDHWNMERPAPRYRAPSNQWDRLANNDLTRQQTEAELEQEVWIRYGLPVEEVDELDQPAFDRLIVGILETRYEQTRAALEELKTGFYQPEAQEHFPPEQDTAFRRIPSVTELTQPQFGQAAPLLNPTDAQAEIDYHWNELARNRRTTPDDPRDYRRRTGPPILAGHLSE